MKHKELRKTFAECLQKFFVEYLGCEKAVSPNTIRSYRDTFVFFLDFMNEHQDLEPDQVKLEYVNRDITLAFLDWLESSKNSSCSTRNQRCSAIKSFARFMMYREPNFLAQWSAISCCFCFHKAETLSSWSDAKTNLWFGKAALRRAELRAASLGYGAEPQAEFLRPDSVKHTFCSEFGTKQHPLGTKVIPYKYFTSPALKNKRNLCRKIKDDRTTILNS